MQEKRRLALNRMNRQPQAPGLLQKCGAVRRPGNVVGSCTEVDEGCVNAVPPGEFNGDLSDPLDVALQSLGKLAEPFQNTARESTQRVLPHVA